MGGFVGLLCAHRSHFGTGNLGSPIVDSGANFMDYAVSVAYGCGFGEAIALSNLDFDAVCSLIVSGDASRGFGAYFFLDALTKGGPNELWDLFISYVGS